jgi:hypothetical protein
MRRVTLHLALALVVVACGSADSDDNPRTTTTTTVPPSTTTTAATITPSSSDYCTTYIELIDASNAYYEVYEQDEENNPDPIELAGFQDLWRQGLHDLAAVAPTEVRSDWEFYRDDFEADRSRFLEFGLEGIDSRRSERIHDHGTRTCPLWTY